MLSSLPPEVTQHIALFVTVANVLDTVVQNVYELADVRATLKRILLPSAYAVYVRCNSSLELSRRILRSVRRMEHSYN